MLGGETFTDAVTVDADDESRRHRTDERSRYRAENRDLSVLCTLTVQRK